MQAVETTENVTYVTKGHLQTPRKQYDPETGWIQICLQVKDPRWQPRHILKEWDSESRTFTEVGNFELKPIANCLHFFLENS